MWVKPRLPQQAEGDGCLLKQLEPQMQQEIFVGGAESGVEVILECPHGTLSSIAVVCVGRCQLAVHVC